MTAVLDEPRTAARSPELLPPLLVLVLGGVLLLRGHGLWYDELFTAETARLPLLDLARAVVEGRGTTSYLHDVPPSYNAPYYVVAHAWLALPLTGDTSLRVLSLLATAGGVWLLVRALGRLADRRTAGVAGLAVAAAPLLVEQSVEARSYGLLVLATGAAVLGLARWLDGEPRALLLFGLAGAGMGLAHWYAVPVVVGLALAGAVLRRRTHGSGGDVLGVAALAALPALALVAVNLASGNGARNADHLRAVGGRLPVLGVQAWTGSSLLLLVVTLVLTAVAVARVPRLRVVATAWLLVPLALVTAAEGVRPVYHPRYLMVTLLALGVLAGAGAVATGRRTAAVLLVGLTLLATLPVLTRAPRERADELVALLAARQAPGEPVVAADPRAALGLDHYVRTRAPRLRADLVLPPQDAAPGHDRVWLARSLRDGALMPSDDDVLLAGDGLRVVETVQLDGGSTTLVLQRWERG